MNDLLSMFNTHLKTCSNIDEISGDKWINEDELNNPSEINKIIQNYIKKRNNDNKPNFPQNIDKLIVLEDYETISIYEGLIKNGYVFTNNVIVIMFFNELFKKNLDENSYILDPKYIKKNKKSVSSYHKKLYNIYQLMEHPEIKKYLNAEIIITDKDINETTKLLSNSHAHNIFNIIDFAYETTHINVDLFFQGEIMTEERKNRIIKKIEWPKPILKLDKHNELYTKLLEQYNSKYKK